MVDAASDRPLIVAAAVVAASHELLYFKSFVSDDQVKLQLAVFASLDFVEEKLSDKRRGAAAADSFLGLLYAFEDNKLFGYVTGTGVVIIIIMRDVLLREDKVRELFRSLHGCYVAAISNTFLPLDAPLASPAFEQEVYRLVEASNGTVEYKGPSVLA